MRALFCSSLLACSVMSAAVLIKIPNGDFEQEGQFWQIRDQGMSRIIPEAACHGKYGLRIVDDSEERGSEMQSQQLPIKAERVYRLDFMARSTGNSQGVGIYLQFYDAEGNCMTTQRDRSEMIYTFQAGADWAPFRVMVQAPAKAATFALRIHSFNAELAQADLDDFALWELSEEEVAAVPRRDIMIFSSHPSANIDAMRQIVPREDFLARLSQVRSSPHPRLFADGERFAELKALALEEGIHQRLRDRYLFLADGLLEVPPCERVMTGRRLLGISRLALYRISTLALSYRISGNVLYRDRCLEEMRAVASFSDWNPKHFLDVAEMTLALATGYDWLYDEMSPADRALCADAIISKGLKSTALNAHWVTATNNWGAVCHAGMIAGALAVAELDPDIAEQRLYSALCNLAIPMRAYAPRGNYPEGPGYWEYGTGFNVLALAMITEAFGTDFGLAELPGFRETGRYNDYLSGPSGFMFNYADSGRGRRRSQSVVWWFARYFQEPELVASYERAALERLSASRGKINASRNNGWFRAFEYLWVFPEGEAERQAAQALPLVWDGQGSVPIVVMRNSWDDDMATYVGLKGGSPRASHGHMDIGSFVLDAGRTRWALDLGAESYHRLESMGVGLWNSRQDGDRWRLFRLNNFSHNTLTIDGQLQIAASSSPVLSVQSDPAEALLDLSPAYAHDCESATRRVRLDADGSVTMTDEISGLKPGVTVVWGLTTNQKIHAQDEQSVTLSDGKQQFRISHGAGKGQWRVIDVRQPQPEFRGDSQNANCHRVELHCQAAQDGKMNIVVQLGLLK
jgi:hypothetical protein